MNKKLLGIFAVMVGLTSMASAAVLNPCIVGGAAISNVDVTLAAGSGNTVVCGAFTFSNFDVDVTGSNGASAQLNILGFNSSFASADGSAFLQFNIGSVSGTLGDILLHYTITGPLAWVDNFNFGTADPNVQIIENVYTTANCSPGGVFSYSTCSNPLTQLVTNGGTSGNSSVFATSQSSVINKDIQFHNNGQCGVGAAAAACINASISEFTNSHHTPVPEPMTLSMMGIGLLGLGLVRRRQQGTK